MTTAVERLWKNEYFKAAVMIVVVIGIVFGLWFGSQIVLGTPYPALAVASGSMCEMQPDFGNGCDGWSHPFGRTLHTGDLIIVEAVDPKTINTGTQPAGDIIVFHRPNSDELIVHRATAKMTMNGLVYFRTKGDWSGSNGTPDSWPDDYRGANYSSGGWISEKLVVGKVIMRIPWIGHLALFMRDSSAIYIIVAVIIVLIIVEFALPNSKTGKTEPEATENAESPIETWSAPISRRLLEGRDQMVLDLSSLDLPSFL
jgi:signal peptidase I